MNNPQAVLICSGEEEKPEVVHEQIREDAAHLSASEYRRVAHGTGKEGNDRTDWTCSELKKMEDITPLFLNLRD
ncbi:hypothetical protein AMELA_G00225280 [Ameiurus melas]|uniref:Uncharacterized protein n=1 Tax=Ameiurus melas TaxID=219545 RepID=A0A7J6A261_AMEME|nr:hypothetical protein AMELA_G00225280 [Ameiurus melas]